MILVVRDQGEHHLRGFESDKMQKGVHGYIYALVYIIYMYVCNVFIFVSDLHTYSITQMDPQKTQKRHVHILTLSTIAVSWSRGTVDISPYITEVLKASRFTASLYL